MSLRLRSFPALASVAALAAGIASPAQAQPRDGSTQTVTITFPQFVAQAVSFKALDETGLDWPGSDEVYAVFADFSPVSERVSATFGDVDAGEIKKFSASDRCIAPLPACASGRSALHFGIALWEDDPALLPYSEFCPGALAGTHMRYEDGLCPTDDLIGRVEVKLDRAQLVAALPTVGGTANYTVKPSGDSGSYEVTYRITRLADVRRTIVIRDPPRRPTSITLEAIVNSLPGGVVVNLTWSGATTSTVDLYRSATKLVTANDGAYADTVGSGTYNYRLCNLNTTTVCSAIVTVTVP